MAERDQPYLKAKIEILADLVRVDEEEIEALKRNIQGMIQEALALCCRRFRPRSEWR